jgi:hypothetical protein
VTRCPLTVVCFGDALEQLLKCAADRELPDSFLSAPVPKRILRIPEQAAHDSGLMPPSNQRHPLMRRLPPHRAPIFKSAELLRDLMKQFGNLGLAAAAYNVGPKRVQDWLERRAGLPQETEAYVQIITGHSADEWRTKHLIALNPAARETV